VSDEKPTNAWDFGVACVRNWWVWAFAFLSLGFANLDEATASAVQIIHAMKGCP
jgi:hypothetical protein